MTSHVNGGVDLSLRLICGAWKLMCAGAPAQSFATADGVEYIFSGLPIGFFNVAVLTARSISGNTLERLGQEACGWAAGKGTPWLFVLTHDEIETGIDAVSILDGCGLAPMMPLTGMIAQQVTPVAQVPEGLSLMVPQDSGSCSSILDVNAAAYGMDLEAGKAVLGKPTFWSDHFAVLGLADDRPASAAAVLMVDGYRYVALVATDPALQRRGYADAAMRRALEIAAVSQGERPTVLHATEAGRPVYQRMGYTPISSHTLFMEKRFLEQH